MGNQSEPIGIRREWLPYLTLAEIVYLAEAVLALITGAYYLYSYSVTYSVTNFVSYSLTSLLQGTPVAVLTVGVSVTWFKLGREIPISLFTNVGILGFTSSICTLGAVFITSLLGSSPLVVGFELFTSVIFIAYFVFQIYGFFKAAKIFQVRLFRFVGYLLIVGLLITYPLSIGLGALYATGLASVSLFALQGSNSFLGGLASLVAGLGFRELRSGQGMTSPTVL